MKSPGSDIIAAIATPIGEGGLSVIRVSGKGSCAAVDRIFRGKQPLSSALTHTAHFGTVVRTNGTVIDETIATVFHAPHSYTGEETVELACHGGVYSTQQVLNSVIDSGCRHARPGEFTERAFLNGKIDLIQAEAVADLIHAGSEAARRSSLEQLRGRLSEELREQREELIRITGLLELELDFAEEEIELTRQTEIESSVTRQISRMEKLVASYNQGRFYRNGVGAVIVGRPNAGKSSLLNALLRHDRAIVNVRPGTTRDTIEESIVLNGMLFRITDTAGLRTTSDEVELEGIARAENEMRKADLIIVVIDSGNTITEIGDGTVEILSGIPETSSKQEIIIVLNKIDLLDNESAKARMDTLRDKNKYAVIPVSAKTGIGIGELEIEMAASTHVFAAEGSILLTNTRHRDALVRGLESLKNALESVRSNLSNELIVVDLRAALGALGELIGETTTDDILNAIFSRFCIGK